jgi:hypothetical protein
MISKTILAAVVAATAISGSSAFMSPSPMALRAGRAPAISPLRMADGEAKVGAAAEKYSKAVAHPKPVLVDADIRKILPHRSILPHPRSPHASLPLSPSAHVAILSCGLFPRLSFLGWSIEKDSKSKFCFRKYHSSTTRTATEGDAQIE